MFKKTVLKNGIRLITAPLKETQTVSLLVLVKVGSRYETSTIGGMSHFVEHMMFKGTKRRPNTLALSKELDGIGAEYNAFTGKDVTGYYIKADASHAPLAVDMLSDMLTSSKLDEAELNKEKGVIAEEINMYEDNPIMYVEGMLEEIMFGGNPLGRQIAGERETVKAVTRQKMLAYKNKHYTGKNIVIALAGNFDDKIVKLLDKPFNFASGKVNHFSKIKISQKQSRLKLKFKDTEQVQVALGLPAYPYSSPKIYPLQLLSVILGGNMSSRLFINVRERKGLAYFVRSWANVYEDTGSLTIQAGLDKNRIDLALETIIAELKKINKGVSTAELQRAKDFIAGKTALDLEESMAIAQFYGSQEIMTGKIMTPAQKLAKIKAVTRADIARTAKEVINLKRLNLAVIGPFKDEKRFIDLIK